MENPELDIEIAKLIGYSIRYDPNYTAVIGPDGTMVARAFAAAPEGYMWSQAYEYSKIPHFSSDLSAAWKLHPLRPAGTILLNLSWLDLPPEKAAYEIAVAFRYWKLKTQAGGERPK